MFSSSVLVFSLFSIGFVAVIPCKADENEVLPQGLRDIYPEILKEFNEIPSENFETLYKIHVNSGLFKASNMTLAGAAGFALSRYCDRTKSLIWMLASRTSFDRLYKEQVVSTCDQVIKIYDTFKDQVDEFLSSNESALTLTHLGSMKSISEKCQVLRDPKCKLVALEHFEKEISRLKRIGLC